jgi:hypothetical protein
MYINKLFLLLDQWKDLPSYQLERSIDIFFAVHLETILKGIKGCSIDVIIPEFPVRKACLPAHEQFNPKDNKRPNQSFKIDYLCYSASPEPKIFLVELKTDMDSRNKKQDWYLEQSRLIGFQTMVEGLKQITNATKKKYAFKYKALQKLVEKINYDYSKIHMETLYIQPKCKESNESTICFEDIITQLKKIDDGLTKEFVQFLESYSLPRDIS